MTRHRFQPNSGRRPMFRCTPFTGDIEAAVQSFLPAPQHRNERNSNLSASGRCVLRRQTECDQVERDKKATGHGAMPVPGGDRSHANAGLGTQLRQISGRLIAAWKTPSLWQPISAHPSKAVPSSQRWSGPISRSEVRNGHREGSAVPRRLEAKLYPASEGRIRESRPAVREKPP
jgi:hypothetical protein